MNAFELGTLQKLEQLETQILGMLATLGELRRDVLVRATPVEVKPETPTAPVSMESVSVELQPAQSTEPLQLGDLSTLNVPFIPRFSDLPEAKIDRRYSSFDRELVIRRCRFKARCIDVVGRSGRSDAEIADLHAEAKDVYGGVYWMLHFPNFDKFHEAAMPDAAQAYRNLASALELVEENHEEHDTLQLVAEAQSALRVAVAAVLPNWRDNDDQLSSYDWLHEVTNDRRIFLDRYMKLTDAANPANGGDLANRLKLARTALRSDANRDKSIGKLWKKLDYELKKLPEDASHWENIGRVVGELLGFNIPASRLEFRERLEPWIDSEHPVSDPLLKVFSAIATYQEQAAEETEALERNKWSGDVIRVAQWLGDGRVVLIGGDCRDYTKKGLEEAFELRELCWPVLEEHDRIEKAYPLIDLPGVRLCLLAIRLSSHSYGPDLARYCSDRNIPLVRLKAGLNPNRVAAEIVRQASDRLSSLEAA
jgi:hypothetical protein